MSLSLEAHSAAETQKPRLSGVVRQPPSCDGNTYEKTLRDLRRALSRRVRRLLRRHGGADADVDDIVQETLLAFHFHRHALASSTSELPWLYAVARNKTIDATRRRARWARPEHEAQLIYAPGEGDGAYETCDLSSLLSQLSTREQGVIRHTALEGRTVEETARSFGVSPGHARVIKHRAIRKLALMIDENEPRTPGELRQ